MREHTNSKPFTGTLLRKYVENNEQSFKVRKHMKLIGEILFITCKGFFVVVDYFYKTVFWGNGSANSDLSRKLQIVCQVCCKNHD